LCKLPPAADSHFLLKSEQEKFSTESIASDFSKYFNVDIKTLNLAINATPFNERHNIRGIEWTEEELNNFKKEAEINEEIYQQHIKKISKIEDTAAKLSELSESNNQQKDLSPPESTSAGSSTDKNSMEKWLDDILDL
jgi:hypothetical protein